MKAIKPITATPAGEVVPIKMVQYGTVVALELKFEKIERENAKLRKLVEQKDAALKQALVYAEAHANRTGDKHAKKDVGAIRAALEAAERGE